MGRRKLGAPGRVDSPPKAAKVAAPAFKQYREKDGRFYFKLLAADGRLLLQSTGFDSPRDAAALIGALQKDGPAALATLHGSVQAPPEISASELEAALQSFAAAQS